MQTAAITASGISQDPPPLARSFLAGLMGALAAFSVLFGTLAAVVSGYVFGSIDHAEQLPIVFRIMDPGYLVNDFQTNAAVGFGPRFYFTHAMAALGSLIPLPIAYAALYLLIYIAVTAITAFAARDITGSMIAALIAATLVASSLAPFALSTPARVTDTLMLPRFLAMPFALCAVWHGIRGRPILSALTASPAILIQPTLGLETAALGWVAAFAHSAVQVKPLAIAAFTRSAARFKRLGFAALIVFAASLFWIVPTLLTGVQSSLSSEEFVRIYAHFRHPHHLIPSGWAWDEYALGALFAAVATVSLYELWKHRRDASAQSEQREIDAQALAAISVFAVCGLAFIGGWFFVEVIPTRLFTIAQTFRLTIIAAWLGWILIAYAIARSVSVGGWRRGAVIMASLISAPTLALYKTLSVLARLPRDARQTMLFSPIAASILTGALVSLILFRMPLIVTLFLLTVGFAVTLMARVSTLRAMLALGGVLLLTLSAFYLERIERLPHIPQISPVIASQQPAFTIQEAAAKHEPDYRIRLATAAKLHTPPDAVILIPWNWRRWRLLSERAVVVDWKFFVYRDEGMKEWHDRYAAIYDTAQGAGYPNRITDAGLAELRRKYGFDYAVLPVGAGFTLPTILSTSRWKLVDVSALGDDSG